MVRSKIMIWWWLVPWYWCSLPQNILAPPWPLPNMIKNVKEVSSALKNHHMVLVHTFVDLYWWALTFIPKYFLTLPWHFPWRCKNMPKYGWKCQKSLLHAEKWSFEVGWYLVRLVLISSIFSTKKVLAPPWPFPRRGQNMPKYDRKWQEG